MPNPTIRISLPGFDAGTDTNLDHFALNADQDNVLIKEYTRGVGTISANGVGSIVHNFGYVPFYLAYVKSGAGTSALVGAFSNQGASAPPFDTESDTGTIYLNSWVQGTWSYYVFYDNFVGGTATFTQSNQAIKVSKAGIDAGTATDPGVFIFHSDLNTFKILKEGTTSVSYTGTSATTLSFAHNSPLSNISSYIVFMKFPDGKTTILPGINGVFSYDSNYNVYNTTIDGTNINMLVTGTGNATLPVKYYIFETPI